MGQQFREFENDLKERKDRIIKDLEGKTYDISSLEGQTKSEQGDLEKLEDAFIIQLKHDYQVATKINEDLHATKDSFVDIAAQFTKLNREIKNAHVDCEDQAPCMAVPTCKIGTASGKSCADIVNTNMDTDSAGDAKNHALSGYYLIQPAANLPPKPTICRNDILGGSFTVVQNRFDGSENFDRNWADYKMGFGIAADFNSPACVESEFWLGNEYLFNIQENKNVLVVDMGRVNGQSALVKYGNFEIGNERSGYALRAADEFSDDECGARVGNSLAGSDFGDQGYGKADKTKTNHIGMKFTTKTEITTEPEQTVLNKTDLDGGSTTLRQPISTVSSMAVNTVKKILPLVNSMMVSYGTLGLKTNGRLLSKLKWLLVKIREPCFLFVTAAQSVLVALLVVPITMITPVTTLTTTTKTLLQLNTIILLKTHLD